MLTNYDKVGWEEIKVVLYSCGMHPRKQVALMTCPYIIENLLLNEQASSESNLKDGLLNEITFVINPIFNIDGFHFNYKYNSDIHPLKEAIDSGTLATDKI